MRLLIGFLLGATAVLAIGVTGGWVSIEDDLCPRLPAAVCDALPDPTTNAAPITADTVVVDAPPAAPAPETAPETAPEPTPEPAIWADEPTTPPIAAPAPTPQPASEAIAAAPPPAPAEPGTTRLPLEFRSEVSAQGFARHLGSVTGADFAIEQRGPGRYAVSYRWADPREREEIARAIALRIGDGGRG